MRRALGACLIVLLLTSGSSLAADARSAVEGYLARLAGTVIENLTVEQNLTLYHPDGRHPAATGSQRLFLKLPSSQRLEKTIEGQREVRLTVGDRVWIRQPDGRTYEAPPTEGRRDRTYLLTAFQRSATDLLDDWRTMGVRDSISDQARIGGRLVTIIGARAGERDRPAVWIDPEYGVVRFTTRERLPEGPTFIDVAFSDYRPLIDRFFYPYRQEVFAGGKLLVLVTVRSIAANTRLSDELFDPGVLKRRG